jgi:Transposase zinc-binding domain
VAALAPAYAPRRPTETVLHGLVRHHLESFLAYAREHYDGGLPRYIEQELRSYLARGDFSRGFTRLSCEACGHDLLVAFSCGSRSICPSCCGRRMANTAAFLVDRVVPDVPVAEQDFAANGHLVTDAASAGIAATFGTVLWEPILLVLRRIAHEDVSARTFHTAPRRKLRRR